MLQKAKNYLEGTLGFLRTESTDLPGNESDLTECLISNGG